jgi:hypothetical protein
MLPFSVFSLVLISDALFQMLDALHRFGSDDIFSGVISLYLLCRIASRLEGRMTAHLNKGGRKAK